jgi:hypothetical protein
MTASTWGLEQEEIAAKLTDLSSKAKGNGERYVQITAWNTAAIVTGGREAERKSCLQSPG